MNAEHGRILSVFLLIFFPIAAWPQQDSIDVKPPLGLSPTKSARMNDSWKSRFDQIQARIVADKVRIEKAANIYRSADRERAVSLDKATRTHVEYIRNNSAVTEDTFLKSWADHEEKKKASDFSALRWSHEYSRYYRGRLTRIVALREFYDNPPAHLRQLRVLGQDETDYTVVDPKVTSDIEILNTGIKLTGEAVDDFLENIGRLNTAQGELASQYQSLADEIAGFQDDYSRRLLADALIRIAVDSAVSSSNLVTGGPGALFVEAGYQIASGTFHTLDTTLGTNLSPNIPFTDLKLLNDYSFDVPSLPEDLIARLQVAGAETSAVELEDALRRFRSEPFSKNGPRTGDGFDPDYVPDDPDGLIMRGALFAKRVIWSNHFTGVGALLTAHAMDPILGGLHANQQPLVGAKLWAGWAKSGEVLGPLYGQILGLAETTVTPQATQDVLGYVTQSANTLKNTNFVQGPKTGLALSFAAIAYGEVVKSVADRVGSNRADILIEQALVELKWHAKHRQMVAHRLFSERYIANNIVGLESAYAEIASRARELEREAERYISRSERPLVLVAGDGGPLTFQARIAGTLPKQYYAVVLGDNARLPATRRQQVQSLGTIYDDPKKYIIVTKPNYVSNSEDETVLEFDVADDKLLKGDHIGVFLFPVDIGIGDNEKNAVSVDLDYYFDLDAITAALAVDPKTGRWIDKETSVPNRAVFEFDLGKTVTLSLRGKSVKANVSPR